MCWTEHSGFSRDIFHRIHKSWLTRTLQRLTLQDGKPRPMGEIKELPKSHGKQVEASELKPRIHGLYHNLPHFSQTPVLVVLIHQTIFNGQTSALVRHIHPEYKQDMSQSPHDDAILTLPPSSSLKNCFVTLCGSSQAIGQFPLEESSEVKIPAEEQRLSHSAFSSLLSGIRVTRARRHWSHSWQSLLRQPHHPRHWAGRLSPHQLSRAHFSYN